LVRRALDTELEPPKAQAVATLLNAQAKGLTERFFLKRYLTGERCRDIDPRHPPKEQPAERSAFGLTFPANLSGKADSEGKRHSKCCGFPLPLEFL
jgi:hypothetical protein